MSPADPGTGELHLRPIGYFASDRVFRYDAPRQGAVADAAPGVVRLLPGCGYEQALRDLSEFERIWLIYGFHRNTGWKPLVRPPRLPRKVGVFASRAPYRPNALGLSCVRLRAVRGLEIEVSEHDLLDGSPVYDIKPYLPYADAFPAAAAGWTASAEVTATHTVVLNPGVLEKLAWVREHAGYDLERFAGWQLEREPTDGTRKRVWPDQMAGGYVLAYRTWRIVFTLPAGETLVTLVDVRSGYTAENLADGVDRYQDKAMHRAFLERFRS